MIFKDYSYIFIATYGRSGSTLLQSLLNSVEGVQIRGENNNALFHLYRAQASIWDTMKFARGGRETEPDEPWYGAGGIRPVWFRNTLLNAFVNNVLRPDEGKTVLGFKEIRYSPAFMWDAQFTGYMDFLLDVFPDSRIIFNTRNAEDVAKSSWNAQLDPKEVKSAIQACDARFSRYDAGSDRTILMRYDDYVADRSKIADLMTFLGHDHDPDRVEAVFAKPLKHAK